MSDPIRIRFDEEGSSNYFFELEMPFPVHAGDRVNYDGYEWEVKHVTWMITEDEKGVPIFMLKAEIK
jgi:hypothetical protein